MIDIHCHILHGIDDGAYHLAESLVMARHAYQDGIRHIIPTPHLNIHYNNTRAYVQNKTAIIIPSGMIFSEISRINNTARRSRRMDTDFSRYLLGNNN